MSPLCLVTCSELVPSVLSHSGGQGGELKGVGCSEQQRRMSMACGVHRNEAMETHRKEGNRH